MTKAVVRICSFEAQVLMRPGFLVNPFGWAANPHAAMVRGEPALLAHLFELDRARMHLIALALAHAEVQPPAQFGLFLARASSREIVERVLGRCPAGIIRALQRLPDDVLERQSYRHLVDLLEEPESAKSLQHAKWISDSTIRLLCDVPVALRRVFLLAMQHCHHQPYGFADALRFGAPVEARVRRTATARGRSSTGGRMDGDRSR